MSSGIWVAPSPSFPGHPSELDFDVRCLEEEEEEEGWYLENDLKVSISHELRHGRGTHYWTYTVSLRDDGLIRLVSDHYFHSSWGMRIHDDTVIRLFHTLMSPQGRVVCTGVPDDILQMLQSASPRLM